MENYEAKETQIFIMNYLAQQSKRNQDIIRLYYGIGVVNKTQSEIAQMIGVSQCWVSRISKKFQK